MAGLPKAEVAELRHRFLEDGLARARQFLVDLDGRFPSTEAGWAAHQWTGTGGLLGLTLISRLASEMEEALAERPVDNARLRDCLAALVAEFTHAAEGAG